MCKLACQRKSPWGLLCSQVLQVSEEIGTYLGLSQDQEVFDYFRRHYAHFFPQMAQKDHADRQTFYGFRLHAPFRKAHAPQAAAYNSSVLGRVRYLIDTVVGQLTDRCRMQRVWARNLLHLRNRLARCLLMQTLCFFFNQQEEAPYLQFDRLVAEQNLHMALTN